MFLMINPSVDRVLLLLLSTIAASSTITTTINMSDPTNPNIQERTTPQWGLYQRENLWELNEGQTPPFNTGRDLPNPRNTSEE